MWAGRAFRRSSAVRLLSYRGVICCSDSHDVSSHLLAVVAPFRFVLPTTAWVGGDYLDVAALSRTGDGKATAGPILHVTHADVSLHEGQAPRGAPYDLPMDLVIGFDLDMTLVDSAEGIADSLLKVFANHGAEVHRDDVLATIGLPLDMVFPMWLPDESYEQLLDEYREHYARFGIPKSRLLPGARDAVDAVHEAGGRVIVISAKKKDFVDRVIEVVQLPVDSTYGYLFAERKGEVLQQEGALVYVGDHEGDIRAARTANALAFVVTTGPMTRAELQQHEPDVIVSSLTEFRPWLEGWLSAR